jgi:hypothetical protein
LLVEASVYRRLKLNGASSRVVEVLQATSWRNDLAGSMENMVELMKYCQFKMKAQFVYNRARFDYLKSLWQTQVEDYQV